MFRQQVLSPVAARGWRVIGLPAQRCEALVLQNGEVRAEIPPGSQILRCHNHYHWAFVEVVMSGGKFAQKIHPPAAVPQIKAAQRIVHKRISGRIMSARASPARLCQLRLTVAGRLSATWLSPVNSSIAVISCRLAFGR